jgi:neopullulanase
MRKASRPRLSGLSNGAAPDWVQDAIFYQIFPDRFAKSRRVAKPSNLESWDSPPSPCGFKGGDLLGIVEKLDYLKDLGINALYFTPIFASTANHRYHTHDYFSVDPILGGNAALAELLRAAHRRGIRVVLDGVFNHASRGFYQFNHTLENGAASPFLDWFHFDVQRLKAGKPLNAYHESCPAPGYRAWWGLPALPKFRTETPAVREFIFSVAEHWLRQGIDGWRLDVPYEIDDDAFWAEFRHRCKKVNPDAYLVGEIWGEARRWLRGDQFDATMNYQLTKAIWGRFCDPLDVAEARRIASFRDISPLSAATFSRAIKELIALYPYATSRAQMNLLDSHDTPRLLTVARGDESALRLASAFLFSMPGAPCIYYGDEIGMSGGCDPDCRRTFPWNRAGWNHGLLRHFRSLAALRKKHPALRRGSFRALASANGIYALQRSLGRERIIAAFNPCREALPLQLSLDEGDAAYRDLSSRRLLCCRRGRLAGPSLPARSSLFLRRI